MNIHGSFLSHVYWRFNIIQLVIFLDLCLIKLLLYAVIMSKEHCSMDRYTSETFFQTQSVETLLEKLIVPQMLEKLSADCAIQNSITVKWMRGNAVWQKDSDLSEESTGSIIRVRLVAYSSILGYGVTRSCEKLVPIYHATLCQISEDNIFKFTTLKYLKSFVIVKFSIAVFARVRHLSYSQSEDSSPHILIA